MPTAISTASGSADFEAPGPDSLYGAARTDVRPLSCVQDGAVRLNYR